MESQRVSIQTPESKKQGLSIMKTTISKVDYDYVYISASKVLYLKIEKQSTAGKFTFKVVKSDSLSRSRWDAPSVIEKWSNDPFLFTYSHWINSAQTIIHLGGMRLLKQQYTSAIAKSHVHEVKNYHFGKSNKIKSILTDIVSDQNICFTGRSGVGKTTFCLQLSARLGIPCVRIQTSSGVTPESFVGGYGPGPDGKIIWFDGLLTQAVRYGWWVILDEWDFAPSSIRTLANPILEVGNRQLILTDKDGGEILSKKNNTIHENFRVFSTGNTIGSMADEADFFGGYSDPNTAQLSRWNVYHIKFLSKDELFSVIKASFPDLSKVNITTIVEYADKINNSNIQGAWFSTRVAIAVATKMRYGLPILDALEPTFLSHHDSSTRKRILQSISSL